MRRFLPQLSHVLSQTLDRDICLATATPVSGGDINDSYLVSSNAEKFFVKSANSSNARDIYEAEIAGLKALRNTDVFPVPAPIVSTQLDDIAVLILEYIPLGGPENWTAMGEQLARLHRSHSTLYGFENNNYIGLTPQSNSCTPDWAEFWWQYRLLPQLKLARENGFGRTLETFHTPLREHILSTLSHHQPKPALVHGDLWRGNVGFCSNGRPAIYDPAVYFGDREVDIAMTQLFGRFPAEFYRAYYESYPLPQGYEAREPIYNLYHLLNHLNIFGSSYLSSCVRTIESICRKRFR